MPNVVGLDLPAAQQSLVSAGVRSVTLGYFQTDPVSVAWAKSTAAPGFVTAQAPNSGATVALDSAVTLTVSAFPVSVSNYGGQGS
jgi:beta-lactam-binding protein with PASTA domain